MSETQSDQIRELVARHPAARAYVPPGAGGLRQSMPQTAAWIDELRQTFGAKGINASIRNGMAGGSDFWAAENGFEIGNKPPAGDPIAADRMGLGKSDPKTCACPACVAVRGAKKTKGKPWAP